jgi:hypothetical protein
MANLNTTALAGPQFYPYCINIDVINGGSATPEGVNIPGAYKPKDYGIAFSPYMTYKDGDTKAGTAQNSKYVSSHVSFLTFLLLPTSRPTPGPFYFAIFLPIFSSSPLIPSTSSPTNNIRSRPVRQNTPALTPLLADRSPPSQQLALIHPSYKHSMMHWWRSW